LNTTNKLFALRSAVAHDGATNEVSIQMLDTQEIAAITKDKPYMRTNAYAADLRYEPESKTMKDVRVNDILTFGGDSYKVIAINKNEVRVLANSNQKPTTIRWSGAP
jgi:Lhr-like helicase